MPQIGWFEILIIVVLAILIIGPKDFPIILRKIGGWMGSMKSYFAKIQKQTDPFDNTNEDYWVVTNVVAISNDTPLAVGKLGDHTGHVQGEDYCRKLFKTGTWKQTSYNTRRGTHYQQDGTISEDQSLKPEEE